MGNSRAMCSGETEVGFGEYGVYLKYTNFSYYFSLVNNRFSDNSNFLD